MTLISLPVLVGTVDCKKSWQQIAAMPCRFGVKPFMVHATFQNSGLRGKIARFRENDMWKVNGAEYYSGTFLTYTNHVLVHFPLPLHTLPFR